MLGVMEVIILLAATLAALATIHKFLYKPVRAFFKKVSASSDTLLGYDEIVDHTTGEVLQQSTPPLANRVFSLEKAQLQTAEALEKIANAIERMGEMDDRIMALAERLEKHEHESHEWNRQHEQYTRQWIDEHNALHVMVDDKTIRPSE